MPSTTKAILGISRVPFLLLPVTLVAAGAAASAWDGGFSWMHALLALVGLVFAHVGVNALNEASDMATGIDLATDRTPFSGGSGTLPSGALSVRKAYVWGLVAVAVAVVVGVVFLVKVGLVLLPLLLLGLICVLAYTPFLTRFGIGEVFAGLGLGALPVIGTSLVMDGRVGPATWAAAVPAFFTTFNLLLLNEFPDEVADRAGGRRHLVIRLGRKRAAVVYAVAVVAVPVSIGVAVVLGALPPQALAACLPTALCLPGLAWARRDPEAAVPMPALGGNVIWNLATNVVMALAILAAMYVG